MALHSLWARLGVLILCVGFATGSRSMLEAGLWAFSGVASSSEWLLWRRAQQMGGDEVGVHSPANVRTEQRQPTALHIPLAETSVSKLAWVKTAGRLAEATRPLWVAALMPLFIFGDGRFLMFGIASVAALWVLAGIGTGVWGRRSPVGVSLLIFLALIPVTLWATPSQDLTREHIGYFLAELVAFYTVLTWAITLDRVKLLVYALVGIGSLIALSAPITMRTGEILGVGGVVPETIQKNVLGGILAALLPLCVGLFLGKLETGQYKASVISAIAAALMLFAIVYSQSHGAYLAVVVSLVAIAAYRLKPLRWIVPGALLGGGVGIWLLNLVPLLKHLLESDSVGDFSVRVEIWARALQVIHDFPLTGIGMGAFRAAVPALYPYVVSDPAKVHHAHNLYLQIGADLGLPGLIAFASLVVCVFVVGVRGQRKWVALKNAELSWLNLGCLGALIAMMTHGLLDAVTWGVKPAFLAWAVLGLLVSIGLCSTEGEITTPDALQQVPFRRRHIP